MAKLAREADFPAYPFGTYFTAAAAADPRAGEAQGGKRVLGYLLRGLGSDGLRPDEEAALERMGFGGRPSLKNRALVLLVLGALQASRRAGGG